MASDAPVLEAPPAAVSPDPTDQANQVARHRRRVRRWHGIATYGGLLIGSVVVLFPIYVLVVDSLLSPDKLNSYPPTWWPAEPHWSNYVQAWSTWLVNKYLLNSIIQTTIIVVTQLVTSILAAYAFVFLRFPFRRTLFLVVLGTVMIPFEITAPVNFTTIQDLGWGGNFLGLTVPFLATGLGIFLLRQAFLQIPGDLREAAVIDGYGPMRFLWRIAIPLARPVIAALAVFSFLGAWNQYLWPSLLTGIVPNAPTKTLQPGIQTIAGSTDTAGITLAAAVISLIPLLILLIFFRKNLIRSLTAGAVK